MERFRVISPRAGLPILSGGSRPRKENSKVREDYGGSSNLQGKLFYKKKLQGKYRARARDFPWRHSFRCCGPSYGARLLCCAIHFVAARFISFHCCGLLQCSPSCGRKLLPITITCFGGVCLSRDDHHAAGRFYNLDGGYYAVRGQSHFHGGRREVGRTDLLRIDPRVFKSLEPSYGRRLGRGAA